MKAGRTPWTSLTSRISKCFCKKSCLVYEAIVGNNVSDLRRHSLVSMTAVSAPPRRSQSSIATFTRNGLQNVYAPKFHDPAIHRLFVGNNVSDLRETSFHRGISWRFPLPRRSQSSIATFTPEYPGVCDEHSVDGLPSNRLATEVSIMIISTLYQASFQVLRHIL